MRRKSEDRLSLSALRVLTREKNEGRYRKCILSAREAVKK